MNDHDTRGRQKPVDEDRPVNGPPSKRIKSGDELIKLIDECYKIHFYLKPDLSAEDQERLNIGIKTIRETLEITTSSSDVSFGATRVGAKIEWGKCLSLMLEQGEECFSALKVLTDRLSPGGGLL